MSKSNEVFRFMNQNVSSMDESERAFFMMKQETLVKVLLERTGLKLQTSPFS